MHRIARIARGVSAPAAAAAALAFALVPQAHAAAAEHGGTYAYAGLVGGRTASAVRATLEPRARPRVERGHVAAWVGVGGPGAGPQGEDLWLQVGLVAFEGATTRLYYEVMGVDAFRPEYVELDRDVRVGERHRVGVVEMVGAPGHWRVWVDGRPVTDPVHLPGSHRRWEPVATAESWTYEPRTRNGFHFRFLRLTYQGRRGGWRTLPNPYVLQDPGLRVVRLKPRVFDARGRR